MGFVLNNFHIYTFGFNKCFMNKMLRHFGISLKLTQKYEFILPRWYIPPDRPAFERGCSCSCRPKFIDWFRAWASCCTRYSFNCFCLLFNKAKK